MRQEFLADFHIHSKYSRATSKNMDLPEIYKWAILKGIKVIATSDWTHPKWFNEINKFLIEKEQGLLDLKDEYKNRILENIPFNAFDEPRFILSSEISCIYKKNDKVRKVHNVILAPDIKTVAKINDKLSKIGNIHSDGRPILGLDALDLLKIALDVNENCFFIPAHIWTPHFAMFGAATGFNSIKECFENYSKYIYAIETGLSSDPPMNWLISELDKIALVSNSDAHSPKKIAREANIFNCALSYNDIITSLKTKKGFLGTIEFFPEEGKYHYDGHRNCNVCFHPKETIKNNYICPECGRKLTVGVMHRVFDLADKKRKEGFIPEGAKPFESLVPLAEIISFVVQRGVNTKTVDNIYFKMLTKLGNELYILRKAEIEEIKKSGFDKIADAIENIRLGKVEKQPGYDGEFGKIKVKPEEAGKNTKPQLNLF